MKGFSDQFVEGIVKRAIKGTISTREAATRLGISRQYLNRLKTKYRAVGRSCFAHGNKGKERTWKTSLELEQMIVKLYSEKYQGFNFKHFLEKLNEVEHVRISYQPLYRILAEAGFKSPKGQRTRRPSNIHPTRPRRENFGELLQIDASLHNWLGADAPKTTLHGAIDDATGIAMGLHFDKEETLEGYYNMLRTILLKYGIPETFYSDNRTIFGYRKAADRDGSIDKDVQTQFGRCCQQLGIGIITTSVPQAKGRIERLWGTLQSRLTAELALNGIHTIDDANAFLPSFTVDFNRRFADPPNPERSLFVPPPSEKEINYYLSVLHHRSIDAGASFKFFGKELQLVDSSGRVVRINRKEIVEVYLTFDKTVVAVHNGRFYETKPAGIRETTEIETTTESNRQKEKWKPAPYHPWRKAVVASYQKRWKQLTQ